MILTNKTLSNNSLWLLHSQPFTDYLKSKNIFDEFKSINEFITSLPEICIDVEYDNITNIPKNSQLFSVFKSMSEVIENKSTYLPNLISIILYYETS